MLKIDRTFTKLFFLIAISFILFFVATYFSLRLIIVNAQNIELYNQVWLILGTLSIFILLLIYFSIKSVSNKLVEDAEHFQGYLDEVSNKNYEAVVIIKYFHEFLEMSLRLKNVVKRLKNRDTKKK